jgi:DNA-binding NarL/FixJ family response regulator
LLLKDCEPRDPLNAVRIVAGGEASLAPSVTRKLIAAFAAQPRRSAVGPAALEILTQREHEVMALVAAGCSNEEIAEQLVIMLATARRT